MTTEQPTEQISNQQTAVIFRIKKTPASPPRAAQKHQKNKSHSLAKKLNQQKRHNSSPLPAQILTQ
jgi:hypothetical protein